MYTFYGRIMRFANFKVPAIAAAVAGAVRDMVVPPTCLSCDARVVRQGGLCQRCWPQMRFIDRPFCEVLGIPFAHEMGEGAVSVQAIADPPPFDRLRSCVIYDDLARGLVSGLKFADRGDLAPWMAGMMARAGRELFADCRLLIPVPLHWRRLHERRYNQSAELGRIIARNAGLDFAPMALVRHRPTERQVGLSASARARNVQGAFRVPVESRPLVEGMGVLVVDDVYTTGATVKACARALKRAGAARVDVLTFASVPGGDI